MIRNAKNHDSKSVNKIRNPKNPNVQTTNRIRETAKYEC